MGLKLSWDTPALPPLSNTPDSTRPLIRRDFKTGSGSEKVKSTSCSAAAAFKAIAVK